MKRANDPRNQFATFRRERFSRSDSAFWKTFSRGVARANLGRELAALDASEFGTFQIASRQARYNATPSTNPRKSLYSQDATWATNTKSTPDQYYASASDSIADFYSTITDAYADYASSVRGAPSTAEQAYFTAQKERGGLTSGIAAYATRIGRRRQRRGQKREPRARIEIGRAARCILF